MRWWRRKMSACRNPTRRSSASRWIAWASGPIAAVMVGDSWANDIAGARDAGIRAVWFNPERAARPARTGERRRDPRARAGGGDRAAAGLRTPGKRGVRDEPRRSCDRSRRHEDRGGGARGGWRRAIPPPRRHAARRLRRARLRRSAVWSRSSSASWVSAAPSASGCLAASRRRPGWSRTRIRPG